jgi:2-C-methyl-D-erythritol 2,4-cyclodiphosphate synthase
MIFDFLIPKKYESRSSTGFDVHKFDQKEDPNNYLMLGGVKVNFKYNVDSHSDGDVVLHALTDAILGCICKGDIGEHFSDKDPQWKGEKSEVFVKHAINMAKDLYTFHITNINVIIICEEPKILPVKSMIAKSIGMICEVDQSRINVQGKTFEKIGTIGRKEGIAVLASVCMMVKN